MLHLPCFHPIADKFPAIDGAELDALTADIEKNGQRKPIGLYQGYIWDGRSRAEACRRLGKQPKYWIVRREDPVVFLIARHNRYGAPSSPERSAALAVLGEIDTPEWKARAKKERSEWMAEARREFRLMVSKQPRHCDVCGQHIDMVHAHHSLPLNIQFDLGVPLANHEHDWLCPLHHRVIHVFASIYLTGAQSGEILENLHPAIEPDWARAEKIFNKGFKLFEGYGGQTHSHARWHDQYS